MQLRIDRHTLLIIPESDQDIAFLEDTLKMREDGDVLKFERVDDESHNWVKFKLESFVKSDVDGSYEYSSTTPSRKVQDVSRNFKNFGDEEDEECVSERITLVDIEEL